MDSLIPSMPAFASLTLPSGPILYLDLADKDQVVIKTGL